MNCWLQGASIVTCVTEILAEIAATQNILKSSEKPMEKRAIRPERDPSVSFPRPNTGINR